MSGIFKGDSIYKSGGGGGGYKDGGALVDGDFIKVENNTVSTYTNETRNDINYYFEVKDGEVINAVIELTTDVNATVHVYIVQNGLYIPLGNIGGNTVNSGEEYNINVVGNSFTRELVTNSNSTPEYAQINDHLYSLMAYNNLLWLSSDLTGSNWDGFKYNDDYYYKANYITSGNWRLPTKSEFKNLFDNVGLTALKSTIGWPAGYNGDNSSGFNMKPKGYYINGHVNNDGYAAYFLMNDAENDRIRTYQIQNNSYSLGSVNSNEGYSVRLVCEI